MITQNHPSFNNFEAYSKFVYVHQTQTFYIKVIFYIQPSSKLYDFGSIVFIYCLCNVITPSSQLEYFILFSYVSHIELP